MTGDRQPSDQPSLAASLGGWLGRLAVTWPLTALLLVLGAYLYVGPNGDLTRYAVPAVVVTVLVVVSWVIGRWYPVPPWHWERRWADARTFRHRWPTYAAQCGWTVSRRMPDGVSRTEVARLVRFRRYSDRSELVVRVTPGLTPTHFSDGAEALQHLLQAHAVDVSTPQPGMVSITLWWTDRMAGPSPAAGPSGDADTRWGPL